MDRSTTFWSSRMFPGQEYDRKSSRLRSTMLVILLPAILAKRWMKYSTSSEMSSRRSRNAGTWIGITFSR
jgi:hypothetical protein